MVSGVTLLPAGVCLGWLWGSGEIVQVPGSAMDVRASVDWGWLSPIICLRVEGTRSRLAALLSVHDISQAMQHPSAALAASTMALGARPLAGTARQALGASGARLHGLICMENLWGCNSRPAYRLHGLPLRRWFKAAAWKPPAARPALQQQHQQACSRGEGGDRAPAERSPLVPP